MECVPSRLRFRTEAGSSVPRALRVLETDSDGRFELRIAIATSTANSPFLPCTTAYGIGDTMGHRVITVEMLLVTRLTMLSVIQEPSHLNARSPTPSCLTTTYTRFELDGQSQSDFPPPDGLSHFQPRYPILTYNSAYICTHLFPPK